MAIAINLTGAPVRVTSPQKQALAGALEVTSSRQLALLLRGLALEGTSPSATVAILIGMQNKTEDGWVTAFTFNTINASNFTHLAEVTLLLRYIRWEVVTLSGTNPALTFSIEGMGRE